LVAIARIDQANRSESGSSSSRRARLTLNRANKSFSFSVDDNLSVNASLSRDEDNGGLKVAVNADGSALDTKSISMELEFVNQGNQVDLIKKLATLNVLVAEEAVATAEARWQRTSNEIKLTVAAALPKKDISVSLEAEAENEEEKKSIEAKLEVNDDVKASN